MSPSPASYSVEDVRRSFDAQKRWEELSGELPALLVFRPISFWVTPLFLRAGCSAAGVTWLSAGAALAMLAAAWRGGAHAHWSVFALGFVFQVLDCVDGNVARVTGTASAYGQLLDLVIGQIYWIFLFVSLGLLVERGGGGLVGGLGLEIALALPLLVLLNRITRNYAQLHFSRRQLMEERPSGPLPLGTRIVIALAGLENVYIFAIALGGALGALDVVLLAIAAYVVGVFLYVEVELLRELRS